MVALENIAFMGASAALRLSPGVLSFVLKVLVVAKRTVVFRWSSGRQRFDTSLHAMTAEIA